jgi:hypothetical protein
VSRAADDKQTCNFGIASETGGAMQQHARRKNHRAQNALLLTLLLTGCSKSPSPPSEPLVTAPPATSQSDIRATAIFNGVQSKYVGHMKAGHLQSLDEERAGTAGAVTHGEYSFYEARLVKYRGDALMSQGGVELEFDLHGALTKSQSASGVPVSAEEISAIRNRAQLLRSHALAARDTQMHQTS